MFLTKIGIAIDLIHILWVMNFDCEKCKSYSTKNEHDGDFFSMLSILQWDLYEDESIELKDVYFEYLWSHSRLGFSENVYFFSFDFSHTEIMNVIIYV